MRFNSVFLAAVLAATPIAGPAADWSDCADNASRLERHGREIRDHGGNLSTLATELDSLQSDLESLKSDVDDCQGKRSDDCREKREEFRNKLGEFRTKRSEFYDALVQLRSDVSDADTRVRRIERECGPPSPPRPLPPPKK